MQYHAIPCNTMHYHAISFNTMQYHAIPCYTMQYHVIPYNTMQYLAIPCIIYKCWRSVPLPCGQYMACGCKIVLLNPWVNLHYWMFSITLERSVWFSPILMKTTLGAGVNSIWFDKLKTWNHFLNWNLHPQVSRNFCHTLQCKEIFC